jgi:hypothetical protein
MNQKTLNIIYGVIIILLIAGALYFVFGKKPQSNTNVDSSITAANNSNNLPAGNQNTQNPINGQPANGSGTIYENQYMKVNVPPGWTAKQASQTIYENGNQPTIKPNPAAVNITKGNYILYINTQAGQASGIEGGRFGEIAGGAPSADAVVTQEPSPKCGTQQTSPAFLDYQRVDLYVSAKDKQDYCNVPSNGATVWYFSYLTTSKGGYFNYYKAGEAPALVVTMAYNSKILNKLPAKGSADLKSALDDMTTIVKSLEIKPLASQP